MRDTAARIHESETRSSAETIAAGREIASLLTPPRFVILSGDLGAGKTTLVKGIAEALNAAEPDEVTSPTFTLIHEYEGMLGSKPVLLYHLDLYRLEDERQLAQLGIDELATPDAIVLVEWGEKFPSIVKRSDGEIRLETVKDDLRRICCTLKGEAAK